MLFEWHLLNRFEPNLYHFVNPRRAILWFCHLHPGGVVWPALAYQKGFVGVKVLGAVFLSFLHTHRFSLFYYGRALNRVSPYIYAGIAHSIFGGTCWIFICLFYAVPQTQISGLARAVIYSFCIAYAGVIALLLWPCGGFKATKFWCKLPFVDTTKTALELC